jgi:hypothetical protein
MIETIEPETIDLDGRVLTIRPMPATKARDLMLLIGLSSLSLAKSEDLTVATQRAVISNFKEVCDTFGEFTIVAVVDAKAGKTHQKRLTLVFDDFFAGPKGQKAIYAWIAACVRYHYGSFSELLAGIKELFATMTESDSPSTSTGSSDDS